MAARHIRATTRPSATGRRLWRLLIVLACQSVLDAYGAQADISVPDNIETRVLACTRVTVCAAKARTTTIFRVSRVNQQAISITSSSPFVTDGVTTCR